MPGWIEQLEARPHRPEPAVPEVRLLDYPVVLGIRQQQRTIDLMRELQLIELGGDREDATTTPELLHTFAVGLYEQYGPALEGPRDTLERAYEAGVVSIEQRYPLYPDAPLAMLRYARLMEDADAFCRSGLLMNLEPDPEVYALRRWTVEEFVRQYHGELPRPWSGAATDHEPGRPLAPA